MHRRPSLTQRDGLFSTTRFILYGNRVRVIHTSPLVREDQYIPLSAVDPSASVVRQPDVRVALMGLGGVFDDRKPVFRTKSDQRIHIDRMTKHMHGDHGGDPRAAVAMTQSARAPLAGASQEIGEAGDVDPQGARVAVDE